MVRRSVTSGSSPSDPLDCSPPGSSVHGIFQARILGWVMKLEKQREKNEKKKNKHKPEHPINVTKLSVAACV